MSCLVAAFVPPFLRRVWGLMCWIEIGRLGEGSELCMNVSLSGVWTHTHSINGRYPYRRSCIIDTRHRSVTCKA